MQPLGYTVELTPADFEAAMSRGRRMRSLAARDLVRQTGRGLAKIARSFAAQRRAKLSVAH